MRLSKQTQSALIALSMVNNQIDPKTLDELSKTFTCGECSNYMKYVDSPGEGTCKFHAWDTLEVRKEDICPRQRKNGMLYFTPKNFWGKWHQSILERDGFQCQLSGKHEGKLRIHLIDGKTFSERNLITLCAFHSKLARYDRFWMKILEEKMLSRFPPQKISESANR